MESATTEESIEATPLIMMQLSLLWHQIDQLVKQAIESTLHVLLNLGPTDLFGGAFEMLPEIPWFFTESLWLDDW